MTRIVWKKIYSAFYIFNNDIRISERGPKLCCKTKINKKNTTNQSRKLLQVNFWPKPSMQNSLISNFSITSLIIMQTSERDPVHDLSLSKLFILFKYIFVVSKYRSKLMLTHWKIEIKMHQKIYSVLQKCVLYQWSPAMTGYF